MNIRRYIGNTVPETLATIAMFALVVGFVSFLTGRYWSDSEIWAIRQGTLCVADWGNYACGWKPLFHLLLSGLRAVVPMDSISDMMGAARVATVAFWLASLAITFALNVPRTLLLCFIGSSLFLLDAGVARSDIWALTFILAHLWCLRSLAKSRSIKIGWLAVVTAVCAFALTPKSGVSLLCFAPLYWSFRREVRSLKFRSWISIILILILPAFFFDWRDLASFFFRMFDAAEMGSDYFSLSRMYFLMRAARENPHLLILLLAWVYAVALGFRKDGISRDVLTGLLLFGATLLFPDALPFWVATQLLILIAVVGPVFDWSRPSQVTVMALAAFAVANGMQWLSQLRDHDGFSQRFVASWLENAIRHSGDVRIYDGIGIVKPEKFSVMFMGPGQSAANLENLRRIAAKDFDVIVATKKFKGLLHHFTTELSANYIETNRDLFVRSVEVKVSKKDRVIEVVDRALGERFPDRAKPESLLVYFKSAEGWKPVEGNPLSRERISSLARSCKECLAAPIRVSPLVAFHPKSPMPALSNEFAFESGVVRLPIWQALMRTPR